MKLVVRCIIGSDVQPNQVEVKTTRERRKTADPRKLSKKRHWSDRQTKPTYNARVKINALITGFNHHLTGCSEPGETSKVCGKHEDWN